MRLLKKLVLLGLGGFVFFVVVSALAFAYNHPTSTDPVPTPPIQSSGSVVAATYTPWPTYYPEKPTPVPTVNVPPPPKHGPCALTPNPIGPTCPPKQ